MTTTKHAVLYRMHTPELNCPFGVRALELLQAEGWDIDEHVLRTREEVDAFKAEHGVTTTPQTFIDGKRVGGYDDLRRYFGK